MVRRAVYSHVTTKFLGCTGYQIFLPMVLRCARESSANIKAVHYALFLPNHIADLFVVSVFLCTTLLLSNTTSISIDA